MKRHFSHRRRPYNVSSRHILPFVLDTRQLVFAALLAGCALGIAAPASAQTMFQPTSVSTTMGNIGNAVINNVINQSGLSTPYTSGVTSLASYNATHDSDLSTAYWNSSANNTTGNVDFDLGGTFTITNFVLWNDPSNYADQIVTFNLISSSDPTFSSSTALGSFTTNTVGDFTAIQKETFSFAPTTARYFRMQVTANQGDSFTAFGEAAFAGSTAAVNSPEPGSIALLALGTGVLILMGRGAIISRRRRA